MTETKNIPEQPFEGKDIYFSGSIGGINEVDYEFPQQLTTYMQEGGATIIDPQVAVSAKQKPKEFLAAMLGVQGLTEEEWNALTQQQRDERIYTKDISLVNQASHVVALVNGVSFGMGMELQRALDKPALGMNHTPILALVHQDNYEGLSRMVRGAAQKYPHFHVKTYTSLPDAQHEIREFLVGKTVKQSTRRQ